MTLMTLTRRHTEAPRQSPSPTASAPQADASLPRRSLGGGGSRCAVAVRGVALAVAWVVCSQASVFAADWTEFVDKAERFGVNLPGQPDVRETTYTSWRGAVLPAKVYTVKDGARSYSVTVVNYQKVGTGDAGTTDVLGSIAWAAWSVRKRPGIEVKYDAYAQADRIEGHEIYLVNADKTQTSIGIFLHASRLYILEANVPAGSPPALQFQQSLEIFDDKGVRVRYSIDADRNRTRVTDTCQ